MFSLIKVTSCPDRQADSPKKGWATAPIVFQTPAHVLSFLLAKRTAIKALSEDYDNKKSPSFRFLPVRLHLEGALVAGFGQKGFAWVWGIYGREFYAEGAVEVEMLAESFGLGGVH